MIVATPQILSLRILFIKDHRPVLVFPGVCRPADEGPRKWGNLEVESSLLTVPSCVQSCAWTAGSGYCGNNARKALVTFLRGQRRSLLTHSVPAGKGKNEECGSRGLENAKDFRNPVTPLFD